MDDVKRNTDAIICTFVKQVQWAENQQTMASSKNHARKQNPREKCASMLLTKQNQWENNSAFLTLK